MNAIKTDVAMPGILAIDTPGHAAFTNLRKRGGNLADIAVVVIDVNEGLMPQTLEAIDILKQYKTPFIIALNKIDLLSGWQSKGKFLLQNISQLNENAQLLLDKKLYEIVGKLSQLGFESERFDRIEDYTKQLAIVPTSARTGDGIPELLMVLTGLAQKYLENSLKCNIKGAAKGTVLEVKEEKGIGKCLDVIIYDGSLKIKDTIVIGGLEKPIVTKVKTLFEPAPLAEMRDKKAKFKSVNSVAAATGVKISAHDIDEVVAGMPLRSCSESELDNVKEEIQKEVEEVLLETDNEGIVIKADSLGSLEALSKLLREKNISISRASVGNINKKDISDAEANLERNHLFAVILGFNVTNETEEGKVKIITNEVIYNLIEDYEKWQKSEIKRMEAEKLENVIRPCKIQLLKGYVFRQSNPAIVGVDVLAGTLTTNMPLMKEDGNELTTAKSMQMDKENVEKAERNKQVAVSLPGVVVGRQINEGDILYSAIPEEDFKKMKDLKSYLSKDEIAVIKEVAQIKRKNNPVWGV